MRISRLVRLLAVGSVLLAEAAQAAPSAGAVAPVVTPLPPANAPGGSTAAAPRYWYGWQTLIADAAAVAVGSGCLYLYLKDVIDADDGKQCFVPFVLASPGVHLVHRGPLRALGSLGLRVGLPVLGLLVGLGSDDGNSGGDQSGLHFDGAVSGFALGLVLGLAIDTLLAFDPVGPSPAGSPSATATAHLAPTFQVRPGGGAVGLVATF